jgi:hypothetical protein
MGQKLFRLCVWEPGDVDKNVFWFIILVLDWDWSFQKKSGWILVESFKLIIWRKEARLKSGFY